MPKGQDFSRHQQGIVRRYYEHLDTTTLQKLTEAASELYLLEATGEGRGKKADRLWQSVTTALARTAANEAQVAKVLAERNVEGLAALVGDLTRGQAGRGEASRAAPPQPAASQAPPASPGPPAPPARRGPPVPPASPAANAATPVSTSAQPGQPAPAPPQPSASAAPAPASAAPTPETLKSALKAFRKRLKVTQLDEASKLGRGPLSPGSRPTVVAVTPPTQFPREVWEELVRQGKLKPAGRGFYQLVEGA